QLSSTLFPYTTLFRSDVFIQCSDFEGTSNSMLESMAQGTIPVVTQTESGLAGIITPGANGFLVQVGDMEAMAEVLCSLAVDSTRSEEHTSELQSRENL